MTKIVYKFKLKLTLIIKNPYKFKVSTTLHIFNLFTDTYKTLFRDKKPV